MLKRLLYYSPLWQQSGLAVIRILTGLLLAYHGFEVFDHEKMNVYATWDSFKGYSSPSFWVYVGKIAELAGGIMLSAGLITRIASIVIMLTMLYISFFVGHGKIWYEDQHPFLFVLLSGVFLFTGVGKYSVDFFLFHKKSDSYV